MTIRGTEGRDTGAEFLLPPVRVRRIVSFDADIFSMIEDWRFSRKPIPNFSESCNMLLGSALGTREMEKRKPRNKIFAIF
jgi:hypothetical protein